MGRTWHLSALNLMCHLSKNEIDLLRSACSFLTLPHYQLKKWVDKGYGHLQRADSLSWYLSSISLILCYARWKCVAIARYHAVRVKNLLNKNVGKSQILNLVSFRIIGIMPPGPIEFLGSSLDSCLRTTGEVMMIPGIGCLECRSTRKYWWEEIIKTVGLSFTGCNSYCSNCMDDESVWWELTNL